MQIRNSEGNFFRETSAPQLSTLYYVHYHKFELSDTYFLEILLIKK